MKVLVIVASAIQKILVKLVFYNTKNLQFVEKQKKGFLTRAYEIGRLL
ncbi:MAG: hypothetical protein ACUVUQ_11160 [Thermodesulfovibrionales bacterium]